MVNRDNYEEYMMLYVDGELNDAAQQELLEYIEQHPECAAEFQLYQQIRVQPDRTQVFPDKESLLRTMPAGRTMRLGNWKTYSAAAAVLLLVVLAAARWLRPDDSSHQNAVTLVKEGRYDVEKSVPVDVKAAEEPFVETAGEAPSPPIQAKGSVLMAKQSNSAKAEKTRNTVASSDDEQLLGISPVAYRLYEVLEPRLMTPPIPILPETAMEASNSGASPKRDLLALLPEEKQQGLQTLKQHVDDKRKQAKVIRDNLKETQLALRLGNKDLFVINF